MLGSTKISALLGSAPPPTADLATLKAYTKALTTELGFALFLVVPGSKEPAECRSTQARNKAIKEAEAAGQVKPTGLHMATTNATHLARWLDKYRKDRQPDTPVNIAVEVGRSGIVLVDVDTTAELYSFRTWWAEAAGNPLLAYVAPTVRSPGVQNPATGEWIHRDGGHFYFTLPQGTVLPEAPGSITVSHNGSQFTVYWRDRYVLIPPSRRPEGDYWLAGTDHPIPDALLDMIVRRGAEVETRKAERLERAEAAAATGQVDDIAAWTLATPWRTILEAAGWINSGRVDSCSCEIWTRPENPANKKSATAHGNGCSDPRFDPFGPPIHIWSDNITGPLAAWVHEHGKTLSKLQFIAAVFHEGDVSAAMLAQGIRPDDGQGHGVTTSAEALAEDLGAGSSKALSDQLMEDSAAGYREALAISSEVLGHPDMAEKIRNAGPSPFATPSTVTDSEVRDPIAAAMATPIDVQTLIGSTPEPTEAPPADDGPRRPVLAPFDHWRNLPPPEYIVQGWVQDQALSAVIGPPGVGKSAMVLDMACSISAGVPWQGHETRKSRVLYIAGEGGAGAAQRIKAWEAEHKIDVGQDLWMITEAVLIGSKDRELWAWLAEQVSEQDIRLVIFDTLARMSLGLEENSATDMGNAVARFDKLRRDAACGVMVVHHTARGSTHGRGSTAILGAMDSEVLVGDPEDDEDGGSVGPGKAIAATVTKQKNAPSGEVLPLTLCERHGSIVVADRHGNTGDPMAGKIVEFPVSLPEGDTELAIRLAEHVEGLPMQGATKTELVRDVMPSKALRKDRNAWRAAITRAVDRGLAAGLLVTIGSDTAQRYGRGASTPDQARGLDRAEASDREVGGT